MLKKILSGVIAGCFLGFLALAASDSIRQLDNVGIVEWNDTTTPSNPASGFYKTYFKNDGKLYKLNSAGTETEVGSAAGSSNSFETIDTATGTNPVAESATDTLTLASDGTIDVFGDSGTDSITLGVTSESLDESHLSPSAAIPYAKLSLAGSLVNADVSNSAAIAYSKLNLSGSIVNADINASAAIADTKLATISTAGKVSNSATTAASANTASAIVARDGSGNFSAGTITAALTGTASGNTTYTPNQYGVVLSGSGNAMSVLAPDSATTKFLRSGGASASPSWEDIPAGGLYAGGQNLISNNSFESNTTGWTASGSSVLARVTTAAHIVPPGVASGSWDPSAGSETLSFTATTITSNDGLSGRNGVLSCAVKTAATDLKMQVYDGSNVISPNATADVVPSSSAGFVRYSVNFIFPSSGTAQARFLSQSNSAIAYIDDCFFGLADGFNVINVSQAQFIGSGYVASTSACTPSRTNTALGAFTDDTDCPGVTVEQNPGPGTLQTTDTDNLDFTFTNLPPGRYLVVAQLSASASSDWAVAINDGTTTSGVANGNGNASTAFQPSITLTGNFVYTSAGDRTFSIWGSSGSGAITIHGNGANGRMSINVYRYPLTSELAYRADLQSATWSGTHGNDCSWSAVTTSLGDPSDDGSCTFTEKTNVNFGSVSSYGSKKPGITFTPNRAGTYQVCGTASYSGNNETTAVGIALYDASTQMGYFGVNAGTKNPITICGNVVASSVSSKTVSFQLEDGASTEGVLSAGGNGMAIVWNITLISTNIPSPVLVGSVLSNSSGATKTISATLNCDAGSTITSQSGTTSNGVATIGNISSGVCAGTFASGTFSATPYSCNADIKGSTLDTDARIDATSATAFNLYCITPSTGAALSACDVTVRCDGAR